MVFAIIVPFIEAVLMAIVVQFIEVVLTVIAVRLDVVPFGVDKMKKVKKH
jgi:hypothetical protein